MDRRRLEPDAVLMPRKRIPTADMTPKGAFANEYAGCKNMLTPFSLWHGEWLAKDSSGRRLLCELTYGASADDPLYGVGFLEDDGQGNYTRMHDINQCFFSRREADAYITDTSSSWTSNGQPE